jgi:hypothetical protein
MRSLTVGWEISMELAARPKLPSLTTARNTVMSPISAVIGKAYG